MGHPDYVTRQPTRWLKPVYATAAAGVEPVQ